MAWYRFGAFELDLTAYVLRREGEVWPMQPKVFDVLHYLVRHKGALVTKNELLEQLWPGEHVNDTAIAWSVSHIRRALGQQRGDRYPIETVAGRGYRFLADVASGDGSLSEARVTAAPPIPATLVGRARVMSELTQRLTDAGAGRGGLSVITGEAGIGKTRCAEELAGIARPLGMQVLVGRCAADSAAPPFWPIAVALRGLTSEYADLAARARNLLSFGETGEPLADQPGSARFRLIQEFAQLLRDVASARPTLLVLDDLHWTDASSLELLGFIAPELRELRLAIVATLRDGELRPDSVREQPLRQLLRHAQTIPLRALDDEQVAELTALITKHRPSPELAAAICRAAGGVPLFVQEIVRTLVREHGETALAQLPPETVRVPALAWDLLRARLQHLPEGTLRLLSLAAVIGDSFDLSLLLAMHEGEPETLLARLEPAIASGLITNESPHAYRFAHSLFRSVLYEDLPASTRVAAHRRAGSMLLARPRDEDHRAEIARHFYLSLPAGDSDAVVKHARAAGDAAQRALAYEEAAQFYGWALDAQVFGGAAEPRARADLLLQLAAAQRLSGRTQDASQTTTRLLELAQQHHGADDLVVRATRLRRPTVAMSMVPDALARAALESVLARADADSKPSAIQVSALSQLACIPPYANDLAQSKQLSARAVAIAGQLQGSDPLIEALRARLFSLSGPDDLAEVMQVADQMLATDPGGESSWLLADARSARYYAHILSGRIANADVVLAEIAQLFSDKHWPEATFFCQRLQAQRAFLDGRFDEADAKWQSLYARAVRAGVSYAGLFYAAHGVNLLLEREGARAVMQRRLLAGAPMANAAASARAHFGRVAAEAGELQLAREQLSLLGDSSEFARDGHYLNLLANLAVCAVAVNDLPRSEQLYALLEPYAAFNTPSVMGYYLGSVAAFLGQLATALGRVEQAEKHFQHALHANEAMGYRPGVVRTLLAHATLAERRGKDGAARDLLARAGDRAKEIGMRAAAEESQQRLQALR